jgi:hypothetical protein
LPEEGGRGLRPRFVKPLAFLLVVALLVFVCKYDVAYTPIPVGLAPLRDSARGEMSVDSVNSVAQAIYDDGHGEVQQLKTEMELWNMSEGTALIQPRTFDVSGCSTMYSNSLEIKYSVSNKLVSAEHGTLAVSVTDNKNGQLLKTVLIPTDFRPWVIVSGSAKFEITSIDYEPIYLIKVFFPTAAQLNASLDVVHLPLFRYILSRVGVGTP